MKKLKENICAKNKGSHWIGVIKKIVSGFDPITLKNPQK